jgi:hypothetical protein
MAEQTSVSPEITPAERNRDFRHHVVFPLAVATLFLVGGTYVAKEGAALADTLIKFSPLTMLFIKDFSTPSQEKANLLKVAFENKNLIVPFLTEAFPHAVQFLAGFAGQLLAVGTASWAVSRENPVSSPKTALV